MAKTLVIAGHPYLTDDSVANVEILKGLEAGLDDVEVVRLIEEYPDFQIDIPKEQERLLAADTIVLQFPYFWYAMPSLLQRWMEEVFQFGFSHGTDDTKLIGKKLLVSLTTGAPKEMYAKDGFVGHEIEEFLAPIKVTAKMCGMNYLGHVETAGVSYTARTDETAIANMKKRAQKHAKDVIELVNAN